MIPPPIRFKEVSVFTISHWIIICHYNASMPACLSEAIVMQMYDVADAHDQEKPWNT